MACRGCGSKNKNKKVSGGTNTMLKKCRYIGGRRGSHNQVGMATQTKYGYVKHGDIIRVGVDQRDIDAAGVGKIYEELGVWGVEDDPHPTAPFMDEDANSWLKKEHALLKKAHEQFYPSEKETYPTEIEGSFVQVEVTGGLYPELVEDNLVTGVDAMFPTPLTFKELLVSVPGIGASIADGIIDAGYENVDLVLSATIKALSELPRMNQHRAKALKTKLETYSNTNTELFRLENKPIISD